jgi:hypothetical protein
VLAPWHLSLGALDELQPSIVLAPGERLALQFSSPSEWPELPSLRIAIVQPGRQIELHPLHAPARSLPLPSPLAPLDDLWLLVRTTTRRHWFEVPYGVCSSPEDPCGEPQVGPPRPPPGEMLDDAVIPWRTIRFSLGAADGCRLELVATSARPGELELEAHRDEPGPLPELAVTSTGGALRLVEPWQPSGAETELVHVARYAFAPDAASRAGRAYVPLIVRVSSSEASSTPSSTPSSASSSEASSASSSAPLSSGAPLFELALPTSLVDSSHRSAARQRTPRGA